MNTRYLRIGDWDRSNPRACSNNYGRGSQEAGLSVYALDATGQPITPDLGEWADVDLQERLASDAPKYIVEGDPIGTGQDGEPLLSNVREVGRWP